MLAVVVPAIVAWFLPEINTTSVTWYMLRFSWLIPFVITFLIYWCWRLIRPLQDLTFPYIGGEWTGVLEFRTGTGQTGNKPVTLVIKQDLLRMSLKLETNESSSRTLAVYPDQKDEFSEYRLYYFYRVERKNGVGADSVYRGTAVIRISITRPFELSGEYYTEHKSTGTIRFAKKSR